MRVPLSWLKAFVDLDRSVEDLAHLLSMSGLEVEAIHPDKAPGDGFVFARVDAVRPHPGADRLRLVTVADGAGGREVVCGAPNVEAGRGVILAVPGATLPDGRVIGEAKIRGILSLGMLCSEAELGLSDDHGGLLLLEPNAAPPGTPAREVLGGVGPVVELSITPNRPDWLSIRGVGREVGALIGRPAKEIGIQLPDTSDAPAVSGLAGLTNLAPARCPTYVGRVISGVEVGPSPRWMVDRLAACGIRSVNNVVDATNYVMLELGQPLHAFDLDRLAGRSIVVRMARDGEAMRFLDGTERRLVGDDLVICDAERPVALAGVMGGLDSGVSAGTTHLLLESACFEPLGVRRSARRHGFHTDSSHRFERGVDPRGQWEAVDRLAQLILELAGGSLADGHLVGGPGAPERVSLEVRRERIVSLLGVELRDEDIHRGLRALGFTVHAQGAGVSRVTPPSWRVDVKEEADVAEEVARMWGYDHIPFTVPLAPVRASRQPPLWREKRRLETYLSDLGLLQTTTYTFITPAWLERLDLAPGDPRRDVARLLKPLSEELSVLRPLLAPSLLAVAARNRNRQSPDVSLFEIGRVFGRGSDGAEERDVLGVVMMGRRYARTWDRPNDDALDLFDLRGVLEGIGPSVGARPLTLRPGSEEPFLKPGHAWTLERGGQRVGFAGELHPRVARAFELEGAVLVAEVDLAALLAAPEARGSVPPLPVFPRVQRDLAIVVDRSVAAGAVVEAVRALKEPLIEDVAPFDVYEGSQLGPGKKSLALSIVYRAVDRTLTEKEVSEVHGRVLERLGTAFAAALRG